jgi:alpha-methylacyl-CoA racemase
LEPQFYAALRARAGLDDPAFNEQRDKSQWPEQKAKLAAIFRTRTRDEWCALLERSDACVAPVLTMTEAPQNAHLRAVPLRVESRKGL